MSPVSSLELYSPFSKSAEEKPFSRKIPQALGNAIINPSPWQLLGKGAGGMPVDSKSAKAEKQNYDGDQNHPKQNVFTEKIASTVHGETPFFLPTSVGSFP